MWRWVAAYVFGVTICVVIASAQTSPAPQFRTGVTIVQLEVSVVDGRGIPFGGLTKTDFSIMEEGSSREVVSAVEIGTLGDKTPVTEVPPRIASEPGEPRLVTIILDDAQIPRDSRISQSAKDIARTIVQSLDASDRAAVLFTRSTRQSVDFTTIHSQLIKAIDVFTPGHSTAVSAGRFASAEMVYEVTTALSMLESVAREVGTISGRRKALFYISTGLALPPQNSPDFSEVTRAMVRVFEAAQRGNVMVYGIDPGGLASGPGTGIADSPFRSGAVGGLKPRHEFLMMLAQNTGGRSIVDRNNPEKAVTQVLTEHSHYYQVAYESSVADTARPRKIQLRVNRPGAKARFRSMNTPWRL